MQLLPFLIFMLLFLLGQLASSWFALGQTLPKSEVDTLKEIAKTLGKDWNFAVDPCSKKLGWFTPAEKIENAVTCNCTYFDNTCHVVSIVLKSQSLPGVLPPELAKLPFLVEIDLTRNYLNGTIPPEWGSMKLVNISLGGNRLSGSIPVELTRISTLSNLTLDMNQLNGSLPKEFGNLFNIERVVLSSNNFTGELPQTLANLTNLKDFRISDNNFTGKIPNFIQNWTKLKRFELQATGLEGPIPPGITLLSNLKDLRISDLNGPEAAFPQLSNMKQMKTLILRRCNIIGGIPPNLSPSEVTEMKNLDLSFNKLTGEIPRDFEVWSKTDHMYFTGNALTGLVPKWMLTRGEGIDLSYNNFTPAPDAPCPDQDVNLFRSFSVGNNLQGVVPCKRSIRCPPNLHSFHINCGGQEIVINETKYVDDTDPGGIAKYFFRDDYFWVSSSTGNFMDNDDDTDKYGVSNRSELSMKDSQLYMTARTSPLSLTYYGFCLMNGNYTVKLHFAEIIFTNDRPYESLGRRLFDVYIQGKRVLTDFNIENEAGSVGKELLKIFPAVPVRNSTLEIRFYWAGKGTTGIPTSGFYGPLISAISVDSDFFVPSETEKMSAGVVAGIVLSALSLIIMVLGILWLKGCLGQKSSYDKELRGLDLQTGSFTLRQIKAATNNFDAENKIGEGGFGSVYKGLLADGTIVAVKQLSSKSKQGNREFVNEIGMISALQHPHLVKLHGCCIEGNQLLLIYEYLENNSLARALFGPEECQLELDWPTRHKICVGIARGLAFLHEESRLKIVHRDIKATNILLDKDLNPKISDFGLAKLDEEDSTHISTRIAGTFGYMAPEYAMRGYLTDKADVYSFGVVALEIVSGRSNSNHKAKKECVHLLDWALVLQEKGNLMELVDPRLGSNYKKEEVLAMINVALSCTNASPTLRPIMSSVVSMLEGRTVVHKFVSDPEADMKFKAIENHYQVVNEDSIADSQAHSIPVNAQWSESSTSALDLYPLNPNSEYWRNRV